MLSRTSPSKRVLLALGVALLASLSLFASLAQGAKLPPENTALPVASPTSPTIGKAETTTNGSWNNEPTSYTYAWLRCSAAGTECVSISGATSSSYTVTEADAGHTLVSAVTAINAFGKTTAQSKPTNKVILPPQYWYACVKGAGGWPTGGYSDPGCTTEVLKGVYGWKKLTAESTALTMNSAPFSLEWTVGGTPFAVSCTLSGEGSINNPASGNPGAATGLKLALSGCALTAPESQVSRCHVNWATLTAGSGNATELEGKPALRLEEISLHLELSSTGEGLCAISGPQAFTGYYTAILNSATSSLEFTKAGSNMVGPKLVKTTITSTSKIATKAGEALKLAS